MKPTRGRLRFRGSKRPSYAEENSHSKRVRVDEIVSSDRTPSILSHPKAYGTRSQTQKKRLTTALEQSAIGSTSMSHTLPTLTTPERHSMKTPMSTLSFEPAAFPEEQTKKTTTILDPEWWLEDLMAVHVREKQGMEDEHPNVEEEEVTRMERQAEDKLPQEHAQDVAKIRKITEFRYPNHDFPSLSVPVAAVEDESTLAKAFSSKGRISRIIQVHAETKLERERLTTLIMDAMKRTNLLEKELKLLEEEEENRATAETVLLAQLQKNREMQRIIEKKRAAKNADIVIPL